MDIRLEELISSYQKAVAECVELLREAGAKSPRFAYEWTLMDFPKTGTLADGREYLCHGIGCRVRSQKGRVVDFDFGKDGEINGFNHSRLQCYMGSSPLKFGFNSHDEMKKVFEIAKQEFRYSDHNLYYLKSKD